MNSNHSDLSFRLTKLEDFCLSLSAHLEGERVLRKEEDQKNMKLYEILSNQLKEIKETQPNETFIKRFSTMKEQLINIIDSKIGEKMIENKNRLESQYIHIKAGEDSMIKKQENVFNHYKFELNNLNKRIDMFENNYDKKLKEMSNKIVKRGPDEEGFFYSNHAIFSHKRLIVIDPVGRQTANEY